MDEQIEQKEYTWSDLTGLQQAFVDEYLKDFNATRAAQRAGYSGKYNTLAQTGHDNLKKPKIQSIISARLSERAMSADEVLMRLGDQARGDLSDFFDLVDNGRGQLVPRLNLAYAKEKGLLHLIKKLKYNAAGLPEIELYDAESALALIGKHHRLFVERHEHAGEGGGPIVVQIIGADPDVNPDG